jgi:hypothetical protein
MKKLIITFIIFSQIGLATELFAEKKVVWQHEDKYLTAKQNTGVYQAKYVSIQNHLEKIQHIEEQIEFYNKIYNIDTTDKSITVISNGNDAAIKEKIKNDFKKYFTENMKLVFDIYNPQKSEIYTEQYEIFLTISDQFYNFITEERFRQIKYLASFIDLKDKHTYMMSNGRIINSYAIKSNKNIYFTFRFNPYEKNGFNGGTVSITSDFITTPTQSAFRDYENVNYAIPKNECKQIAENTYEGWWISTGVCRKEELKQDFMQIKNYANIGFMIWASLYMKNWGSHINLAGIYIDFDCEKIHD